MSLPLQTSLGTVAHTCNTDRDRSEKFQNMFQNLGRKLLALCRGNIITGLHLSSLTNLTGRSVTMGSLHLNKTGVR